MKKNKKPRRSAVGFPGLVTPADAEAFHAKNFTPRTMANAYRRSWQSLRVELEDCGIMPFSQLDRDYARIVLREEVERHFAK